MMAMTRADYRSWDEQIAKQYATLGKKNTVYWFTPHTVNPTPGVVPNSGYIGELSPSQESLQKACEWFKSRPEFAGEYEGRLWAGSMNPPEKPRGRFETIQEELNKLHDQRIDRFEELLDQFDTLHAEFGE